VFGGTIGIAESWSRGPSVSQDDRWDPAELGKVVPNLVEQAAPAAGAPTG